MNVSEDLLFTNISRDLLYFKYDPIKTFHSYNIYPKRNIAAGNELLRHEGLGREGNFAEGGNSSNLADSKKKKKRYLQNS